jgi:hypothetical protein
VVFVVYSPGSDIPHGRGPSTDDSSDFSMALERFTQTLTLIRRDDLSDFECDTLRLLLDQLLRVSRRGPI